MIYQALYLLCLTCVMSQLIFDKDMNKYRQLFEHEIKKKSTSEFSVSAGILGQFENQRLNQYIEISPKIAISLGDNSDVIFKQNVIYNQRYYSQNPEADPFYEYKNFRDLISYTEEGYLYYSSDIISIKFGRFIDKLGVAPLENLTISNNDYHDGFKLSIDYKDFNFSNRFFQLAPQKQNSSINRYFHQHGLGWRINENFDISIHEVAIYATRNSMRFSYLNPFSVYHANQLNDKTESNTNYSIFALYNEIPYKIWFEMFIDDFQIDSEKENISNSEPSSVGMQIGIQYKFGNNSFYANIALITNRTYNDQNKQIDSTLSYSKYIDHGKVIGYHLGSNIINLELMYQYKISGSYLLNYEFSSLQRGDESVFSDFDESFLFKSGKEPIPSGVRRNRVQNQIRVDGSFEHFDAYIACYLNTTNEISEFGLKVGLQYSIY